MGTIRTAASFVSACIVLVACAHATELDVKRIAIFNSGVAYFESDGTVRGADTAELTFRTEQINDILKSLVVQDFDGGSVGVVSYPSRDPIEKTLRSFGVDITGDKTLADLLRQLRGEPVEISGPSNTSGVIFNVETTTLVDDGERRDVQLLTILTAGGLRQIDIRDVSGIKLVNEKVAAELNKALATLATAHDADKKTVTLAFSGPGERRVRASYLLEAPIWKTSYRLVLDDNDEPFLQGWATVENATEEDWQNVQLSLVSGRPVSFRMDLYTPLYVPRPMEQLELYAGLRPPSYEESDSEREVRVRFADHRKAAADDVARRSVQNKSVRGSFGVDSLAAAAPELGEAMAGSALAGRGVVSAAAGAAAGELFEYTIQTPVSIARQSSAMLPIVNEAVGATKLSIYNPQTHPIHPMNGLKLTNETPLSLMQGPITIFEDDVYAGDSKLPNMQPKDDRLLAYALDLATTVNVEHKSNNQRIVKFWIKNGVLYHRNRYIDEREYTIKSKRDRERDVLLEQQRTDDWNVLEPANPELTSNHVRVRVTVPANETVKQTIKLERLGDTQVRLSSIGLNGLHVYLKAPAISEEIRQALEHVIALRTALDRVKRERERGEKEVSEALKDEERIRQNLRSLPKNSDQYRRQLEKFDQVDKTIVARRDGVERLRTSEEQQRRQLEDYLRNLTIE